MKCANCGKEMEQGGIRYGRDLLYYLPKNGALPFLGTKKELIKKGSIPLWRKRFSLGMSDEDWPEAYVCRDCKQVVIPYEEG